jgi:hypothetical protein
MRTYETNFASFAAGAGSALTSVFVLVLAGTYIGIGALTHNLGLSPWWLAISTALIFAAPAQVILITALGAGSPAVRSRDRGDVERDPPLSYGCRAFARAARAKNAHARTPHPDTFHVGEHVGRELAHPAIGSVRAPRSVLQRAFGRAYCGTAVVFGFVGSYLAAGLPALLSAALLFITPLSFLMSTARNARAVMDRLALVLGLLLAPLLTYFQIGLDLMWTGVIGGTLAYATHRLLGLRA